MKPVHGTFLGNRWGVTRYDGTQDSLVVSEQGAPEVAKRNERLLLEAGLSGIVEASEGII